MDFQNATRDELMAYAKDTLGMKPNTQIGVDKLREKVIAAAGSSNVAAPAAKKKDVVTIMIHETDADNGGEDVFIGYNDKSFLIQRGVNVDVPRGVAEILEHAVEDRYEMRMNKQTNVRETRKREVMTYPFTYISK